MPEMMRGSSGMMGGGMMAPTEDDLYNDEPAKADTEAAESETLIAKSALPKGVKEGDRVMFIVTGDYGEEVGLAVAETSEPEMTDAAEVGALDEPEY